MNRDVMERPTRNTNASNGFAIEITDDTDLGLAMLIVESEDGDYEPIGVVANIAEARGIAQDDFRSRIERVDRGESPLCPYVYRVWARGIGGEHRTASEISVATLTGPQARRKR